MCVFHDNYSNRCVLLGLCGQHAVIKIRSNTKSHLNPFINCHQQPILKNKFVIFKSDVGLLFIHKIYKTKLKSLKTKINAP